MPDLQPGVTILHGDDEFGIAEFIQACYEQLGDPTMADVNTTRLDGRTHTIDDMVAAARAMPFLTSHRLVVFNNPLERARHPAHQKRLRQELERLPATTKLILAVDRILTDERSRRGNRVHWLERWALGHTDIVAIRAYPVPVGVALARWIQARARHYDGQFTQQAANLLAQQVGPELRVLDHEIQKLLAYVNYDRPVEGDDIHPLTPVTAQVGDFALVNAIRDQNGRQALKVLHRHLEDEDPIPLFHRVVYQFRVLLQVREVMEEGGNPDVAAKKLGLHPYAARVSFEHARRFSMDDLESIYHRLLEIDTAMKTGGMPGDLALDVLVTELTA